MNKFNRCCTGGGGTCQICRTVYDCSGGPVSGATVTVTQSGTTIGTGTTNGSGFGCVSVPAAGTYTVTTTMPTSLGSYPPFVETVTVACPAGSSTVINPPRNGATGYQCCGGENMLISSFPATVHWSEGGVSYTLSRNSCGWGGTDFAGQFRGVEYIGGGLFRAYYNSIGHYYADYPVSGSYTAPNLTFFFSTGGGSGNTITVTP